MNHQQPIHVPQSTNAQKSTHLHQTSLQLIQLDSPDDDVAKLKAFMDGYAVIDDKNPPNASFCVPEKMELAFSKLHQPVVDSTLYADFHDEPSWLKARAERLLLSL